MFPVISDTYKHQRVTFFNWLAFSRLRSDYGKIERLHKDRDSAQRGPLPNADPRARIKFARRIIRKAGEHNNLVASLGQPPG